MGFLDVFRPQKRKEEQQKKRKFEPFNVEKTDSGSHDKFHDRLLNHSMVILLTGRRGSGKSSLGMRFLEMYHYKTDRKCYVLGYGDTKLPRWIKKVDDLDKAPVNSTVLIDEGAIFFSSRDSMKKSSKELGKIMAIARHKNLTLILITQSSAMIDLNVLRLADVVLLKEPSLLQTKFERKGIKDMYERVSKVFKKLDEDDIREKYFFVWSDDFEGLLSYDLPGFWSDNLSKAFRKF